MAVHNRSLILTRLQRLRATGYRLRASGFGLRATGYRVQVLLLKPGARGPEPSASPRRIGFSLTSLVVLLGVSSAWGQQIVEETSTRFPSPNPAEYTNQLTIGDLDGDTDLDIVFANGGNFGSPGPLLPQRVYINDGDSEVLPMRYSGWQVYRGALPGQQECFEVEYWVTATDFNNNTGIGETQSFTVGGQPGDLDGDCDVDAADLAQLLGAWGRYEPCPPFLPADLDQDCAVGAFDLAILLGNWGP